MINYQLIIISEDTASVYGAPALPAKLPGAPITKFLMISYRLIMPILSPCNKHDKASIKYLVNRFKTNGRNDIS